jgi:hypothetical protein
MMLKPPLQLNVYEGASKLGNLADAREQHGPKTSKLCIL